jgi:hypothetical protein
MQLFSVLLTTILADGYLAIKVWQLNRTHKTSGCSIGTLEHLYTSFSNS